MEIKIGIKIAFVYVLFLSPHDGAPPLLSTFVE